MHKLALHHTLLALALALSFGAAGTATAATATGNMTMSGAITYAAPPASCTISSPNVDATYEVPYGSATYQITKNTTVSVNCTSGTSYSLRTAAATTSITMGSTQLKVGIVAGESNIGQTPFAGIGNGAEQSIPLTVNFTTPLMTKFTSSDIGSVSGSVALIVTY